MASWTQTLDARVLAHVPRDALYESYNTVLHEEFAALAASVDAVATSFVKLEEVHDAVSKLEQSHGSRGKRSENLRLLMDIAMGMGAELQQKVEKIAVGMQISQLDKKRKREEDVDVKFAKVQTFSQQSRNNVVKEVKGAFESGERNHRDRDEEDTRSRDNFRGLKESSKEKKSEEVGTTGSSASESESEESDDDIGGSEAAWKALMAKDAGQSSSSSEKVGETVLVKTSDTSCKTENSRSKTATYMSTIMKDVNKLHKLDRAFVIPELLVELKESVDEEDGHQQSHVLMSLNILVGWWADQCEEQSHYIGLYRDYAAAVKEYVRRIPVSPERSQIQRSVNTIAASIEALSALASSGSETAKAAVVRKRSDQNNWFCCMVGSVNRLPSTTERKNQILYALVAFKKQTAANHPVKVQNRIVAAANTVAGWMCEGFRWTHQLPLYRMFVEALHQFSETVQHRATKGDIDDLRDRMADIAADKPSQRALQHLRKNQARALRVLKEVNRYTEQTLPVERLEKLLKTMTVIISNATLRWDPRHDAIVNKCATELKTQICRAVAIAYPSPPNAAQENKTRLLRIVESWLLVGPEKK